MLPKNQLNLFLYSNQSYQFFQINRFQFKWFFGPINFLHKGGTERCN